MWGSIIQIPWIGVFAVVLSLVSLIVLAMAASAKTRRTLVRLDGVLLFLGLLALVAWAVSVVRANPSYGTDEAAFIQYATQLWLHGKNPYNQSLLPALNLFGVPIQYATYTLSGGISASLGYPGYGVLFTAPFIALTHGVQSVVLADLVSAAIGMVVMFFVLPPTWRSLSVVIVVDYSILFGYVVSGDIAIMLLPLLVLVAWRWTEIGSQGRLGLRGWANAGAMGAAISVEQMAWFLAPFVIVGIFIIRRRELGIRGAFRAVGRYVAVVAGVFLVINSPFLLTNPIAFLRGIFIPIIQHAIPYGQGIIDLANFAGVGGGDLSAYTVSAMLGMLGLLVIYATYFDRLWRAAFILPAIVMWFPARSLAEYWMTLIVVWVVAIIAAAPPAFAYHPFSWHTHTIPRWISFLVMAPAVGVLGLAILTPSPLVVNILHVHSNGQLGSVWEAEIRVTNRSDHALQPHYAADSIGQMTSFWQVENGSTSIPPHSSRVISIDATNTGSMPGITQKFQIEAVTPNPPTVAVTSPYTAEPYILRMSRTYVTPLPLGKAVKLHVELRTPFGAPAKVGGVRIQLGQIVYGQFALIPAEASINGHPQGQTPVQAITNRNGVATFRLYTHSQQNNPLYFQAWALGRTNIPYGYTSVISIIWKGK
jgi:uncharacterized membrane protein